MYERQIRKNPDISPLRGPSSHRRVHDHGPLRGSGSDPRWRDDHDQVAAASPDLGTIITLLRTINDQVSLVAENTRPPGKGIVTGNIALFDNGGDTANTITDGTSVIALPQGSCDIAVYGDSLQTFITVEEMKDYTSTKYSRNYQACAGVYLCRKTVALDDDFSYLYLTYKPYDSTKRLTGVTLSYRCKPF